MKNLLGFDRTKKKPQAALAVCALLFFTSFFVDLTRSFAADDSLASLQQEIILAKQKHQLLSNKVVAVQTLLESDKSPDLKLEADKFLEELASKEPIRSPSQTQAVQEVKTEYKIPAPKKIVDKSKPWFDFRSWYGGYYYSEKKLSDGEALYRVSVSDHKITLKEAIEIGLANHGGLLASKKKVEVADSKLTEAKRALFPTISGSMDFNGGINVGRFFKGESRKITVSQPVFYGGELVFTVRQAEENLKSAKEEYTKQRHEAVHEIRTAYYGVVKAEYNAQYQFELYDLVNTLYRRLKKERQEKLIAEVDFLNAESKYEQVYFQLESATSTFFLEAKSPP